MNELKQWSIWAARIGLLFSFFLYIGDSYVEEEFYPAAVVTFLIFWATFVPIPEEYHSEIKSYGSSVLWNGAALALLFFVFYASSTAAVLINEEALPGLFSLLRNSGISLAWIIVIPGLLLTPFIPRAYPLFEFVTERTRERAPSTSSVRSMSVGQPRTPASQTYRAPSTTRSEPQGSPAPRARRDTPNGSPSTGVTSTGGTSTGGTSTGKTSTGSTSTGSSPNPPAPPNPEASTSTT